MGSIMIGGRVACGFGDMVWRCWVVLR
jgi:hypothetical protein